MMKKLLIFVLVLALTVSTAACAAPAESDLMKGIEAQKLDVELPEVGGESAVSPMDFAVSLFKAGIEAEKNTLISPVSVLYALAVAANGAKGETREQMEEVLGMPIPELNAYLKAYMNALPQSTKAKLSIANSVWFTDDERFAVERDFLQTNADYYGADIYKAAFDDGTLKAINTWVKDNTDGMIENILDEISPEAVMYLINAMAFDAEWQDIYFETQINDGVFVNENGEEQNVKMMRSEEHYYLEDDNATGFMKHYANSKYAFAALLPQEGISVEEYVAGLTGEGLASMLEGDRWATVYAAMPKFESEYSIEMSGILSSMGMTDAFDQREADFSGLGSSTAGNIFISRVIHKAFISVDERGTKAGAATVVDMAPGAAPVEEIKEVTLDRPFVYMIIDCEANLPLFMGTMKSVN